ncbi:hypothetical protein HOD29_00625 [archaeon]|jgi:Icc-related predicted phosphoesterase|nr:hypothetical protein [archaeon]
MVKILVIGDLHGQMPRIHFKDFDYIACVGDVCDDSGFRPFAKQWFALSKKMGDDAPSVQELIDEKLGEEGVEKLEKESLKKGRKILEYLNSFGKPIFFVPGNWDQSYGKSRINDIYKNDYNQIRGVMDRWFGLRSNKELIKGFENVYDLQFGLYASGEFNLIGYGLTNNNDNFRKNILENDLTKFQRKELNKYFNNVLKRLPKLWDKRNKKAPTIFISHNMPEGIMDKSLIKNSHTYKKSLGSWVARDFCLKKKPEICIGGHMHEYYGQQKLRGTNVVNAGYGRDAQVLLEIKGKKVRVKFVESLRKRYRGKRIK